MNLPNIRLALSLCLPLLTLACSQDDSEARQEMPKVVKTYDVVTEAPYITRHFIGEIVAKSTVDLSFQVAGRLAEIHVNQGDIVPEGTLLATLDDADYRLAVRNAEADLHLARADVQRKRNLVERGAVSGIERDVAEANYEQAQVQLDSAQQDLERTRLYAPYDAMVARRMVDPQSMVSAQVPILMLQDMSELRVRTQVPETFFERLVHEFMTDERQDARETGRFEASLLSTPTRRYPLVYREHVSQAVASTQTYQVEFAFVDYLSDGQAPLIALPGMVANVSIQVPTSTQTTSVRVPIGAIQSHNEHEFYVFVLNEQREQVSRVAVRIERFSAAYAHIESGLQGGESIVAAGVFSLNDGDQVTPMDEAL